MPKEFQEANSPYLVLTDQPSTTKTSSRVQALILNKEKYKSQLTTTLGFLPSSGLTPSQNSAS